MGPARERGRGGPDEEVGCAAGAAPEPEAVEAPADATLEGGSY